MRRWLCTATMDVFGWWERAYWLVHHTRCARPQLSSFLSNTQNGHARARWLYVWQVTLRVPLCSYQLCPQTRSSLSLLSNTQKSIGGVHVPHGPMRSHPMHGCRTCGLQACRESSPVKASCATKAKLVYKDFFVDNAMEHNSWLQYVAYF